MKQINEVANKASMPCNKPRRSTRPGKKMMVKACEGGREKIVHFGAKGYGHNYSSAARKSFRARHKCGQKKSKLSAQYWACRKLWAGKGGSKKSCPSYRQCKEALENNINTLSEGISMERLTLRTLIEKKLNPKEKSKKKELVKRFKKMPYFKKIQGKKKKASAIYGTATKAAKISEEVVNKDHQPMTKAEISARNRCYKGSKMKPGPTLKNNDSPANSKARKCTFAILRSTRGGKGGAISTSWAKYKKQKKGKSKKSKNKG